MKEKFKCNLSDKNREESPSGIAKFFSAIFMCGVDNKDNKNRKNGQNGTSSGCCAGPRDDGDGTGNKENNYDIQPTQSVCESELLDAMERRKKKKKRNDKKRSIAIANRHGKSQDVSSVSSSSEQSSSSSDGFDTMRKTRRRKRKVSKSSDSSNSSKSDVSIK